MVSIPSLRYSAGSFDDGLAHSRGSGGYTEEMLKEEGERSKMNKQNAKLIGLALVTLLGTACAMNPTIDTSADAELSYDGLYPVEGTRLNKAWARRDVDLSGYNKIMLQGVGIQYRPVKKRATTRSGGSDFPIPPERKKELREVLREGFVAELAKTDRFEIVSEPGPDVLLIRGALIDVVSHVPPQRAGRSDVYLSSVGEATLVIELIDSQSESVLIRGVDRRAAEVVGVAVRSNSVSNRSEVRRLAGRWGRSLREGLEFLANDFNVGETN